MNILIHRNLKQLHSMVHIIYIMLFTFVLFLVYSEKNIQVWKVLVRFRSICGCHSCGGKFAIVTKLGNRVGDLLYNFIYNLSFYVL